MFEALRQEGLIIAGLWDLLFCTGVRPGTALAAKWSDIDLARKLWEVPVTKKARGNPERAGKPFVVPLSPQAIAVLKLLQSIQRVREKAGVGDVKMRDIRRTVATDLGKLKVPPVTISRVLDHAKGQAQGRPAAEAWSATGMPRGLARILTRIRALAARDKVRFTLKALRELATLGLDARDARETLEALRTAEFVKRLVSAVTGEGMYVFKPRWARP